MKRFKFQVDADETGKHFSIIPLDIHSGTVSHDFPHHLTLLPYDFTAFFLVFLLKVFPGDLPQSYRYVSKIRVILP